MRVEDNSLIEGCSIAETSGWGLSTHFGSRVVNCIVSGSSVVGMLVYGSVIGCTVRGNGSSGMQVHDGAVIGCIAEQNGGIGISIDQGMVIDCQAKGNSTGIVVGQRSLVRGCTCTLNDNAGIAANFNANRIESNTCIENDTGIQVTDTNGRSVITGNTCIDSRVVAFNIASGNVCFAVAAATAAAISGSAGGVSPGSTSPWANFAV